jgi:hypothetical protein
MPHNSRAAELLALALLGDEARLRALLPAPGNLREEGQPDRRGSMTALMGAAAGGNEAAVELLLQCGADLKDPLIFLLRNQPISHTQSEIERSPSLPRLSLRGESRAAGRV